MIAMQYRIALPADYDMGIIRQRIAERGHLTDGFPRLAFKAYLYADRHASPHAGRDNCYAPFYLWHDTAGMNAFLSGAGFAGVTASFGRPAIRLWSVWHAEMAPDLSVATHATCESAAILAHEALSVVHDTEHTRMQAAIADGALAAISAFSPTDWTVTRFRLWGGVPIIPDKNVDHYQIGHVSQPSKTA